MTTVVGGCRLHLDPVLFVSEVVQVVRTCVPRVDQKARISRGRDESQFAPESDGRPSGWRGHRAERLNQRLYDLLYARTVEDRPLSQRGAECNYEVLLDLRIGREALDDCHHLLRGLACQLHCASC